MADRLSKAQREIVATLLDHAGDDMTYSALFQSLIDQGVWPADNKAARVAYSRTLRALVEEKAYCWALALAWHKIDVEGTNFAGWQGTGSAASGPTPTYRVIGLTSSGRELALKLKGD